MEEKNPYEDIIHLPHHQAANRPHMSLYNRAAQFSPYAALTGYGDMVLEEARQTEIKHELGDFEKEELDQKLFMIQEAIQRGEHPLISAIYFVPDERKAGGAYKEYAGLVKKIDTVERQIIFLADNGSSDGKRVRIDDIKEMLLLPK